MTFSIYVHWPFCRSLCPYCDFNSHVRESVDQARWRGALLAELDHFAADVPGRTVTSVFFGGGTPSLMAPETVAAVLEAVGQHWTPAPDLEVTLEANPTSVEAGRLAEFRAAGVNRVSLGVQALDDDALRALGRQHTAQEALDAVALARTLFDRVSFDLIYARPDQSPAQWRDELRAALRHADGHLSLYQLTIEPGTVFHQAQARGDLVVPDDDTATALYEVTQEVLDAAGLPAYEVSNHARPGEACRHNLSTWRYDDYVGIGPGAHGRLTIDGTTVATRQHRVPEAWLALVERDGHATRTRTPLEPTDVLAELTLLGLRLTDGIAEDRFRGRTGTTFEHAFGHDRLGRLIDGGFLVRDDEGLRTTPAGRQRLNAVTGALLA